MLRRFMQLGTRLLSKAWTLLHKLRRLGYALGRDRLSGTQTVSQ